MGTSVNHSKRIFVEASAGTGKTTMVVNRVASLIDSGLSPQEILITTFTRAGAKEISSRLISKNIHGVSVETIHAFSYLLSTTHLTTPSLQRPPEDKELESIIKQSLLNSPLTSAELLILINKDPQNYITSMTRSIEESITPHTYRSFQEIESEFHTLVESLDISLLTNSTHLYKGLHYQDGTIKEAVASQLLSLQNKDLSSIILHKKSLAELFSPTQLKARKTHTPPAKLLSLIAEAKNPHRIFHLMRDHIIEKLTENGLVTHDKILLSALKLTNSLSWKKRFAKRFKACIVDEFQDTDPIQWGILKNLFWDKFLMVVGDPKQAIYSFRGGDTATFFQSKSEFDEIHYLSTNYRASHTLLKSINNLFAKSKNLPYHPLSPGSSILGLPSPLEAAYIPSPPSRLFPSKELERSHIFPYILNKISQIQNGKSIAILVKDKYQADRIREYLKEHGIYTPSTSLEKNREYALVKSIWNYLNTNRSISAIKEILFHPHIREYATDEASINYFLQKVDSHKHLSRGMIIKKVLLALGIYKSLREEELFSMESSLSLLLDEEAKGIIHPSKKRLDVVTTHSSKGLEYDYTFLLGISSHTPTLPKDSINLFYVALTRSKEKAFLIIPIQNSGTPLSPTEAFLPKDKKAFFADLSIPFTKISPIPPTSHHIISTPQLPPPPIKSLLHIDPPTRITTYAFSNKELMISNPHPSPLVEELPSGIESGIKMHTIMEKLISSERYLKDSDNIRELIEEELYATPFEGYTEPALSLVQRALEEQIGGIKISNIPPENLLAESYFEYLSRGTLIRGYIDLIISLGEEKYIVDWKFSYLPDYSKEAIEREIASYHYLEQAQIYSRALTAKEVIYIFPRGGANYKFYPKKRDLVMYL